MCVMMINFLTWIIVHARKKKHTYINLFKSDSNIYPCFRIQGIIPSGLNVSPCTNYRFAEHEENS